jgi:SAM-dependent methyltransferase
VNVQTVLDSAYWNTFYGNGNDWGQPNAGVLGILTELQQAFKGTGIHVLDLACGNGRYAVPLAGHGAKVDCVDFSETAIAQLEARARERDVSGLIQSYCGDVRLFPIEPEMYHLVLASGLFEYLTETELAALVPHVQTGTVPQGINAFVWLLQHAEATLVPQEYPVAPGTVESMYLSSPGWHLVCSQADLKDDFHPLEKGGKPQKHKHYIGRMVAKKLNR